MKCSQRIALIFLFILLLMPVKTWGRCFVVIVGGMADKPYTGANPSRHITRMNFVEDKAKQLNCKVLSIHNKKEEEFFKQINEFVQTNKVTQKDKIHFSILDHGGSKRFPLAKGSWLGPDEFFKKVDELLPDDIKLTYTTQICRPRFHEAVTKNNYNFQVCGGSSVDKDHKSMGKIAPQGMSIEDQFYLRTLEYAATGWDYWKETKQTNKSLFDFHYKKGILRDTTNSMAGIALTSTRYIRELMKDNPRFEEVFHLFKPDMKIGGEVHLLNILEDTLFASLGFSVFPQDPKVCPPLTEKSTNDQLNELVNGIDTIFQTSKLEQLKENSYKYPEITPYMSLLLETQKDFSNERIINQILSFKRKLSDSALNIYRNVNERTTLFKEIGKDIEKLRKLPMSMSLQKKFFEKYSKYTSTDYLLKILSDHPHANIQDLKDGAYNKAVEDYHGFKDEWKGLMKNIVPRLRVENDIEMINHFMSRATEEEKQKFLGYLKCETSSAL